MKWVSPVLSACVPLGVLTLTWMPQSAQAEYGPMNDVERPSLMTDGGEVTVYPAEYPRALRNPLKGFRPDVWNAREHEWATLARHCIEWNNIENSAGDGVDRIIAFCDEHWHGLAERNIKVIPRVYLEWPNEDHSDSRKYWPSDMEAGDYSSDEFKRRTVALIAKLGKAWDDDPRVAYIESGILGYWGEQHTPEPTPEIEKLIGDAFTEHFKNKLVMVRYPMDFRDYRFGIYWDSWGTTVDTPLMMELLMTGPYAGRWKIAPMGGEVSYNYGNPPGTDPTDGLVNHIRYIEDLVRRLHWNHLGWIANYDPTSPDARGRAERLQKAFGYRFVMEEVRYSGQAHPGGELRVSFRVRNTGSSPLYYNWPVEVSLLEPDTMQPAWTATFEAVDVRQWLPGEMWVWWANEYERKPAPHTVTGAFRLPPQLPRQKYVLALAILDPAANLPAVRLAITNYAKGGRHPIGYIGVGPTVTDPALDKGIFDDPFTDDSTRYDDAG